MSISSSTVGPAIRRLRRQQGLTQTAMAGRLQISPSYLNLIERGQRPITPRLVEQMVELF
ncbi:MAG TPA: helix-turn-helix transcriptional regulator, partial [Novosphingobium sp.]|nr:helix-turn-helix transcriptional regulator [Novosphingobium sp.]